MTRAGNPMLCPDGQGCTWGGMGGCQDDICARDAMWKADDTVGVPNAFLGLKDGLTPETLRQVGEACWGPRWQSALAHAWQLNERTVRSWLSGRMRFPPARIPDLLELLRERRTEIDAAERILLAPGTPPICAKCGGTINTSQAYSSRSDMHEQRFQHGQCPQQEKS